MKLIGSLPLNDGRKTGSPYFRKSRPHTFKNAGFPACLIARMQDGRNVRKQARKRERLLSIYQARLIDGLINGMKE